MDVHVGIAVLGMGSERVKTAQALRSGRYCILVSLFKGRTCLVSVRVGRKS